MNEINSSKRLKYAVAERVTERFRAMQAAGQRVAGHAIADLVTVNGVRVVTDDGTGSFTGYVTLDDGTLLNFYDIENIICFTPGTLIDTAHGPRPIETLQKGDLLVTEAIGGGLAWGAVVLRW